MKNKTIITVIVTILVLVAVISLGYILLNGKEENKNINNVIENNVENEVIEDVEKIDNGENVTIKSRRGIEVLTNLDFVSNLYSNLYYDELDSYGLSNNAKVIASFIQIVTTQKYQNLIKEEDMQTYISKYDLEYVAKEIFADTNYLVHAPLFGSGSYVEEDGRYYIPSTGYLNLDYTIEVPYKITEFDDRVEVVAYRVYVSTTINTENEENITITDTIYYDRAMLQKAIELKNGELSNNEENKVDFIRDLISSKSIDESNLTSVKYTLKKENDKLLISDYTKGV